MINIWLLIISTDYSLLSITYFCTILTIGLIRGISSIINKRTDLINYYPIGKRLKEEIVGEMFEQFISNSKKLRSN